jgi:hypothetical protein
MEIQLAKRLRSLAGKRVALLDCGKRGSSAILDAIARRLRVAHGSRTSFEHKVSAHRMASRALVERLSRDNDAVVYGIAN